MSQLEWEAAAVLFAMQFPLLGVVMYNALLLVVTTQWQVTLLRQVRGKLTSRSVTVRVPEIPTIMVTFLLNFAAWCAALILGVATLFSTGALAWFVERLFRKNRTFVAACLLIAGFGMIVGWMVAADLLMVWAAPMIQTFHNQTLPDDPSRGAAPGTWYRVEFPVWNILGWLCIGYSLAILFASKFFSVGFLILALAQRWAWAPPLGVIAFYACYMAREWLPILADVPHYRAGDFRVVGFHLLCWTGVFVMLSYLRSTDDLAKVLEDAAKK